MTSFMASSLTLAYIGNQEILLIAGIALLLFGGAKLPELARGLGKGIREFKNAVDNDTPESAEPTANTVTHEAPTPPTTPTTPSTTTTMTTPTAPNTEVR